VTGGKRWIWTDALTAKDPRRAICRDDLTDSDMLATWKVIILCPAALERSDWSLRQPTAPPGKIPVNPGSLNNQARTIASILVREIGVSVRNREPSTFFFFFFFPLGDLWTALTDLCSQALRQSQEEFAWETNTGQQDHDLGLDRQLRPS